MQIVRHADTVLHFSGTPNFTGQAKCIFTGGGTSFDITAPTGALYYITSYYTSGQYVEGQTYSNPGLNGTTASIFTVNSSNQIVYIFGGAFVGNLSYSNGKILLRTSSTGPWAICQALTS